MYRHTVPFNSVSQRAAAPRRLHLRLLTAAAVSTWLLVAAATAHAAGQCSALAPTADAAPDDRIGQAHAHPTSTPLAQAAAPEETATQGPVGIALAVAGRPSDPSVQPCRHLPREQMIECVQRVAAAHDPTR